MNHQEAFRIAPPPEKLITTGISRNKSINYKNTHLYGTANQKIFNGFTLAEVLITLGVIGVIAAITIPTAISRYNKQNAEVRLKKFYSTMNQAINLSIEEHGEIGTYSPDSEGDQNAEAFGKWIKENITKYMTTIKDEKLNNYYYQVVFMDGSGFQAYGTTNMYVFYRLNFNTKSSTRTNADGKNEFLFIFDGKRLNPIFNTWSTRDLKNNCYKPGDSQRFGCAALIMKNGWKLPEDYPWIR